LFESEPQQGKQESNFELKVEEQINEIDFKEVTTVESADITVSVEKEGTEKEVRDELIDEVKKYNWWLQNHWREKGSPTEQINIKVGKSTVSIYNFREKGLKQDQISRIQDVLEKYQSIIDGQSLEVVDYILIDDEQKTNPNDGKPQNGRAAKRDEAIILYPNAFEEDHRVPGVDNLAGTVAHELGHSIEDQIKIKSDWMDKFGWSYAEPENIEELPSGKPQGHTLKNADQCVTNYAKMDPIEDLCESMVAALYNPDTLDKDKLNFIEKKIFTSSNAESSEVKWEKQPEVPKIDSPVTYKKQEGVNFKIE
jgi:hypothetical protein